MAVTGTTDSRFAPVRDAFAEVVGNAPEPAPRWRWSRRCLGRRPVGRLGRCRADEAVATGQSCSAVLGVEAVRRDRARCCSSTAAARARRADAAVLAVVLRARDGASCVVAPGGRRRDRRAGGDGGVLRLGSAVLATRRPGASVGTRDGARGVGALLRPSRRRARPACGRSALGRFLREEVGCDFHFGLTGEEQARAVELTGLESDFGPSGSPRTTELYRRALREPTGSVRPGAW